MTCPNCLILQSRVELNAENTRLKEENTELRRPTFFEVVTAIAFRYLPEHGVDLAVMEAGMGGRLSRHVSPGRWSGARSRTRW